MLYQETNSPLITNTMTERLMKGPTGRLIQHNVYVSCTTIFFTTARNYFSIEKQLTIPTCSVMSCL
jgi:hypothetical protein